MDEKTRIATRNWTLAQPIISAFLSSVVRDFSVRDDLLQNTAIAVLESFDRYDPQRPFVSWALGIAQNQVRLYYRQEKRQKLLFDETCVAQISAAFEAVDHDTTGALRYLNECLRHLEGRAKILCELRYISGLKPAAISAQVGMTANGVAKALQRIREQLRACINEKLALERGSYEG